MRSMRVLFRRLTQGQPPATMTVARNASRSAPAADAAPAASAAPPDAAVQPEPVDAQAVARRVYELMRQELAVEADRRGSRRW
jgi:hypothetical protein